MDRNDVDGANILIPVDCISEVVVLVIMVFSCGLVIAPVLVVDVVISNLAPDLGLFSTMKNSYPTEFLSMTQFSVVSILEVSSWLGG